MGFIIKIKDMPKMLCSNLKFPYIHKLCVSLLSTYLVNQNIKNQMKIIIVIFLPLVFLYASAFAEQQEIWEWHEPMPTPRGEHTVIAIDDMIYVIGGHDVFYNGLSIVEVYDTKNDSWSTVSPMPKGLHHMGIAVHDEKIYVVGGYEQGWRKASNSLFIYDPTSDIWTAARNMPTARGGLTAEFIGDTLYAVGGADHFALSVNEAYNVNSGTWEKKSPMTQARDHLKSAAIDGKMYVIGGRDFSPSRNFGSNEVYYPETDTWKSLTNMPTPRGGHTISVLNNTIFVFGGEGEFVPFENNEQYLPEEDLWITHTPMLTPRHGLGSATVGDRIYVIGGGVVSGLGISNINESYYNPEVIPEFDSLVFSVLAISLIITVFTMKIGFKQKVRDI